MRPRQMTLFIVGAVRERGTHAFHGSCRYPINIVGNLMSGKGVDILFIVPSVSPSLASFLSAASRRASPLNPRDIHIYSNSHGPA